MATFQDNKNRDWIVQLDAPTIRRVREQCDGLDLADVDGRCLDALAGDPCLLVDVIWAICLPQAAGRNITGDDFAAALVGDALERVLAALTQARVDFFPTAKKEILQSIHSRREQLEALAIDRALSRINDESTIDELMDLVTQRIDAEFGRALERLRSAPGSQELPAPAPTA